MPALLGVSICGSSFGPDSFLCLTSQNKSEELSEWQEILKQRTWLLLHGNVFFSLRMTSKTVGCCEVPVFLRLREVTDGGSLPLAVKKLVGTDAAGVQGRV